jgi:hypothetical protein
VLGEFLHGVGEGLSFFAALRRVRAQALWHSAALSLVRGFLGRESVLRAYLSHCRIRAPDLPSGLSDSRRRLVWLFGWLTEGREDIAGAFEQHGMGLHLYCQQGLA